MKTTKAKATTTQKGAKKTSTKKLDPHAQREVVGGDGSIPTKADGPPTTTWIFNGNNWSQ